MYEECVLIVGDPHLANSRAWIAVQRIRIEDKDAEVLQEHQRGVFDFDISVKRDILPEFEFPIPKAKSVRKYQSSS